MIIFMIQSDKYKSTLMGREVYKERIRSKYKNIKLQEMHLKLLWGRALRDFFFNHLQ